MLPLKRRVRKELFPEILNKGVFLYGTNFYLRLLDRKDILPSLFSVVVPNKVIKTSVGRHLLKRRVLAVVEKLLTAIKPGFSILIFAKRDVSEAPFEEIEAEIKELLKKVI